MLDGETGIVVDARTPAEVAAGILRLLSQPEQARALGASGSRRVHRELTWPLLARRFEQLLNDAAATRPG